MIIEGIQISRQSGSNFLHSHEIVHAQKENKSKKSLFAKKAYLMSCVFNNKQVITVGHRNKSHKKLNHPFQKKRTCNLILPLVPVD